jgi:hypothetical protein
MTPIDFIGITGFIFSLALVSIQIFYNRKQNQTQLKIAKDQIAAQMEIAEKQFRAQGEATERQFRADVLSRNRQEWINDLREEIAEFVSYLTPLTVSGAKLASEDDESWSEFLENMRLMARSGAKIELLLNTEEAESKQLSKTVSEIRMLLSEIDSTRSEKKAEQYLEKLDDLVDDLFPLAQTILKREWNLVKQGK